MLGSTNLNSRSADLDTELSFLMVTPSELQNTGSNGESVSGENSVKHLRQQLRTEIDKIREDVVGWKGGQRRVRHLTKAIVHLVKDML